MIKQSRQTLLAAALIILALSACQGTAPAQEGGSFQVWIDAPLDEAVLPLAPYEIVLHASSPHAVSTAEILIDGELLLSITDFDRYDLLSEAAGIWSPSAPGVYTIQVRAADGTSSWAESAQVRVRIREEIASPPPAELDPLTPEPAACAPLLTAPENASCRTGPSVYHAPVAYLLSGETVPAIAQNRDGSWWLAILPDETEECWISGSAATATCTEGLPFQESPPYITRITKSSPEFYWGDNPLKTITIQAQVDGESPVSEVLLVYHLQGKPDWRSTALVNSSGAIWEGAIQARSFPNFEQISSAWVEYYLQAASENGLITKTGLLSDIKLKKVP